MIYQGFSALNLVSLAGFEPTAFRLGVSSTQIQVVISREKCTKNGTQKIKLVQNRKN